MPLWLPRATLSFCCTLLIAIAAIVLLSTAAPERATTDLFVDTTTTSSTISASAAVVANMIKKLSKASTNTSLTSTASNSTTDLVSINGGGPTPVQAPPRLLPSILTDGGPLPRLIVFDLDYTLWPFWVDTHVYPPLKTVPGSHNSAAVDKVGETFAFYNDVPSVLHGLGIAGIKLAVASRTSAPDLGRELLKLLHVPALGSIFSGIGGSGAGKEKEAAVSAFTAALGRKDKARRSLDFFDAGLEIYPSSKIRHFEAIHKKTGIPFTEMLFFDDESRNRETESLGVTMRLVRDGVSWQEVEKGIMDWRKRRAGIN